MPHTLARRFDEMQTTGYTFGTTLPLDQARPRVEAALRAEGFGVLTEIDVAATMRARLGVELTPYLILGGCNPALAHRALEADPSIGALLPCNVVLREDGPVTVVEAIDPLAVMALVQLPEVEAVATEAEERLRRGLESLEAGAWADPWRQER